MIIIRDIYEAIIHSFSSAAFETGGMLGGKDHKIIAFYRDKDGVGSANSYSPDIHTLNHILKIWNKQNIMFAGLIHTHKRNRYLSISDLNYGEKIINSLKKDIILGVFVLETEELFLYHLYKSGKKNSVDRIDYEIIDR